MRLDRGLVGLAVEYFGKGERRDVGGAGGAGSA